MLKRIEVVNFRSLLNLSLDIPSSYFCIVGDNNVGKSNIATALKWIFDPTFAQKKMALIDLSRTTSNLAINIVADVSVVGAELRIRDKQKRKLIGSNGLIRVGRRFTFAQPVKSLLVAEVHTDYASDNDVELWAGGPQGSGPWLIDRSFAKYYPQLVHIRPSDVGRAAGNSSSAATGTASSEEKLLRLLWPDELTDDDRQWVKAQLMAILAPSVPFLPQVDIRVHDGTGKIIYWDEYGYFVPLYKAGSGIVQIVYTLLRIALARRRSFRKQQDLLFFIDEPEQHLASGMQKSYSDVLATLSHDNQIIVTSHSGAFVRRDIVGSTCVLIRGEANGTESRQSEGVDVAAIRTTLGITGEDSLYFGEVNVLVEGPTEVAALQQLFSRLHRAGLVQFRPDQLTPISCEGIDKIIQFAKVFTRIGLGIVIVVDNENRTKSIEKELQKDPTLTAAARVLRIPLSGTLHEAEFEDLFPRSILIEAVNEHIGRRHNWHLTDEDLQTFYASQPYNRYKKWGDCLTGMLLPKHYITDKSQVDEKVSKPAVMDAVIERLAVGGIPEFITGDIAEAVATMLMHRPHPTISGISRGIVPPGRNTTWLHEANLTETMDHDQ